MRALIVDDEPLARQRLKRLLAECPDVSVIGEAGDTAAAAAMLPREPDLIFLDIEMPGETGLDWAERLRDLPVPPAIIFTTAHPQHALEAFRSSPVDYLLKPVEPERLASAMARVRQVTRAQQQQEPTLTVRLGRHDRVLRASELVAIFAEQKYARIVFDDGEALVSESLKDLEQQFDQWLIRIHRHSLVSRQRLKEIELDSEGRHLARIAGLDEQPEISRRALRQVREMLGL